MPPGTFDIVIGIVFLIFVLAAILVPIYEAGKDHSGAVEVTARRTPEGVRVRLERLPLTKGVVVRSIGVSRELADELGLRIPDGLGLSMNSRWLLAEGRIRLEEKQPLELLFAATRKAERPVQGTVRVLSTYRPGVRRVQQYTHQNVF